MERVEERPMLGYGYAAFWAPRAATSERVRAAIGWDAPHSHNGLLDVWLDLGLGGVVCLLAAYTLALRRAWTGLRTRIGIEGVWAVAFLVMLFLGNATESAIWSSFLIWTIFVAVACMYWSPVEEPESWTLVDAPPRGREGTYAIR
jgi:O-antigen ligase